jgi:glycine hydroxymethyltransferase
MIEHQMEDVVELIDRVLMNADNEKTVEQVKNEVKELMTGFPLYPELG